MAIAWLYRDEFALAPSRVATVVDPSGRTAAWIAVIGAAALVPVSLVPVWAGAAGWGYGIAAAVLGLAYLFPAIRFLIRRDDRTARTLLRASFIHLPGVFLAILIAALL
jgi:protoheme IX farnesyltransferase